MQFIKKILGSSNSDTEKKSSENSAMIAIVVALITALSSGGFMFGFFNDNNDSHDYSEARYYPASNAGFITAKTRIQLVDLNGEWNFSTGDNEEWAQPGFDDSSWRKIHVPSQWEKRGLKDYDGFAWYRRSFRITSKDAERPLFAFLGQIDDVDEVFINGHRIGGTGSFPPTFVTAWNSDRVYQIPKGILFQGENNVISVRVYDDRMGGGIHRGAIGLFTTDLIQPLVNLSGSWKFKTGDNPNWKEAAYDDTDFSSIQVPIAWEFQEHQNYDGYAWYRKTFEALPVSGTEMMVLLLGKIDDTDQVFLNGELIGETGKLDHTDLQENSNYYRKNRVYEFPSSLLGRSNLISVRVHDSKGYGGIYSGPVGIMTKENYQIHQAQLDEAGKWNLQETIDWLLGRNNS